MAAGLPDVVALVGTAARVEWIPASVRAVVLALDGDAAGQERAETLRHELRAVGLDVAICTPPAEDGRGKDWSERWRLAEWDGVLPVFDAWDTLAGAGATG
jgi:DNA primase